MRFDWSGDSLWTDVDLNFYYYGGFLSGKYLLGDTMVVGGFMTNSATDMDFRLVLMDTLGNVRWDEHYGGANNDYLYTIDTTVDGGYVMCGYSYSYAPNGGADIWLVKTDALGNLDWHRSYGGPESEAGLAYTLSNGDILVVGGFVDAVNGLDSYVARVDLAGNTIWDTLMAFNPLAADELLAFVELANGDLIIAGDVVNDEIYNPTGLLVKMSADGDLLWKRTYRTERTNDHYFRDIIQTSDGDFCMAGFVFPDDTSNTQDIWLVKVDEHGCVTPGCHLEPGPQSPSQVLNASLSIEEGGLEDFKIYPNPSSSGTSTMVSWGSLLLNNPVLDIISTDGKSSETIYLAPGSTQFKLSSGNYSSGTYIIRLSENGEVLGTRRWVVE